MPHAPIKHMHKHMLAQIVVNSRDLLTLLYIPLFRESWPDKSIIMPTMHASTVNQNTGEKFKICYKTEHQRPNMHKTNCIVTVFSSMDK